MKIANHFPHYLCGVAASCQPASMPVFVVVAAAAIHQYIRHHRQQLRDRMSNGNAEEASKESAEHSENNDNACKEAFVNEE